MDVQWLPPAQWSDFEEMIFRLIVAENSLTSPFKYGRRGQQQHGIDIGGARAISRTEWEGFQCKLKTEHLGARLAENEIIQEVEKAKAFGQSLRQLTFVTTGPRDKEAQDVVMALNSSASKKFEVAIWFWDDVVELLKTHEAIARRFYPQFFPTVHVTHSRSGGIESHFFVQQSPEGRAERLSQFSREPIFAAHAASAPLIISTLAEIIENALSPGKGKATRVTIEFDGTQVRLTDNGVPFDPLLNQATHPEQYGLQAIQRLRSVNNMQMTYLQRSDDNGICANVLCIEMPPLLGTNTFQTCVGYSGSGYLYSRSTALQMADSLDIPITCDPYVFRISGSLIAAISGVAQLVPALKQRLGTRGLKIVVPANREDLFHFLRKMSERYEFEVSQD